jgi:hypothetical protein
MNRKRYLVLCFLVVAGASFGGYVANRSVLVVHAQTVPPTDVRGSSFTLVNAQGQVQATLRSGQSGAELVLNGTKGNGQVEISPAGGLIIRDAYGRIVWRSPRTSGIIPLSAE